MTGREPTDTTTAQPGYVYLVKNEKTGFFKIGSARKPNVRLKQLETEMRATCVMLHTIATNQAIRLERAIQERFIGGHRGGEWFDLCACDVEAIMSVSTVFYLDAEWQPKSKSRSEFDAGAKWAKGLPICAG